MHLPGAEKNQLGFLNTTNNHNLSQGLRVSSVQRKRAQTPNSDPSALARGQFNLMLADANSDRLFTLNQSGRLRVWHHQLAWPEDPVSQDSPSTSLPVREEMMAKYSNLSLESHNISLTEHSSMPVEKNITLEKPSNIELVCQFTKSGDLNSVNVTWRKDDELLENNYLVNATGNILYTQYKFTIIDNKQLGSYSCVFEEGKEQRGTFNFKVPEIHGKSKPLITYVGDSTVLVCKCQDCFPSRWTWYSSNGSVQIPVDAQMNNKYVVNGTYANETRLKITQLSEEDGGSYWCQAVFQLGESEEQIELVVLSYLVPLKPFLAIVAEVVLLVAIILLCEMYTQKKKKHPDHGKEFEQIEHLKSDDSNGIENNAPRHRKNESMGQ